MNDSKKSYAQIGKGENKGITTSSFYQIKNEKTVLTCAIFNLFFNLTL